MKIIKGVSLLEIMIALVIFGTCVISILSLIFHNIVKMDKLKLNIQSVNLSREGIEIIFNQSYSNVLKGLSRNCAIISSNICIDNFNVGKNYQVSINISGYNSLKLSNDLFDDNILYLHFSNINDKNGNFILSGNYYDYNNIGGIKSNFSRFINFTGFFLEGDGLSMKNDKILKINSIVKYKKGSYSGETILESIIGDK